LAHDGRVTRHADVQADGNLTDRISVRRGSAIRLAPATAKFLAGYADERANPFPPSSKGNAYPHPPRPDKIRAAMCRSTGPSHDPLGVYSHSTGERTLEGPGLPSSGRHRLVGSSSRARAPFVLGGKGVRKAPGGCRAGRRGCDMGRPSSRANRRAATSGAAPVRMDGGRGWGDGRLLGGPREKATPSTISSNPNENGPALRSRFVFDGDERGRTLL